jgi:hypothetical protein
LDPSLERELMGTPVHTTGTPVHSNSQEACRVGGGRWDPSLERQSVDGYTGTL